MLSQFSVFYSDKNKTSKTYKTFIIRIIRYIRVRKKSLTKILTKMRSNTSLVGVVLEESLLYNKIPRALNYPQFANSNSMRSRRF